MYAHCILHSPDVLCVFFFKQKTAYEMSVSDWSSDVCSSDLTAATLSASMATPSPEMT